MVELLAAAVLLIQDNPEKLIEELGSDDYAKRTAAMNRLRELGPDIRPTLEKHREHPDPEVRSRIGELLSETQFLPVSKEARGTVEKLDAAELDKLKQGVEELLKLDRTAAIETLNVCADKGTGRLQYRAKQLRQMFQGAAASPLRYGILVSRPEYGVAEKIDGLEIWLNESDKEIRLKDVAGRPNFESLEPEANGPVGVAGINVRVAGGLEPSFKSFGLAAGASRIESREDLSADETSSMRVQIQGMGGKRPGACALSREYASDLQNLESTEGDVWEGTRKSNRVEFRLK